VNRRIVLGIVAVALLVTGVALRMTTDRRESPVDPEFAAGNYPVVVGQLCDVKSELANGKRTNAYNVFYGQAHGTLHALAADVDAIGSDGRTMGGALRKAKARVEAGLLNPGFTTNEDLDTLIGLTGQALDEVGAPWEPC
jgi:hypothetical protein